MFCSGKSAKSFSLKNFQPKLETQGNKFKGSKIKYLLDSVFLLEKKLCSECSLFLSFFFFCFMSIRFLNLKILVCVRWSSYIVTDPTPILN